MSVVSKLKLRGKEEQRTCKTVKQIHTIFPLTIYFTGKKKKEKKRQMQAWDYEYSVRS